MSLGMSRKQSKSLTAPSLKSAANGSGEESKPPKMAKISKILSKLLNKEKITKDSLQNILTKLSVGLHQLRFSRPSEIVGREIVTTQNSEFYCPLSPRDEGDFDVSGLQTKFSLLELNTLMVWWYISTHRGQYHDECSEKGSKFGREFWEFQLHPLGVDYDHYFFLSRVYDHVLGEWCPLVITVSGRTFPIEWYTIIGGWYGGSAILKDIPDSAWRVPLENETRKSRIASLDWKWMDSGLEGAGPTAEDQMEYY